MRSLLFAPGASARMLAKATESEADIVICDLEDSVAPGAKGAARQVVAAALGQRRAGAPAMYVRINPLGSAWCEEDLRAVLPSKPDGVVLPKAQGPADLERLAALLARWEIGGNPVRIIAICTETPAALLSLSSQSWAHPRLAGMLWGGEDLAACLGAASNRDEAGRYTSPYQLARSLCLIAARAACVTPIDAVFTDFRNMDGLKAEAALARRDGFAAKAAIHPAQIPPINAAFQFSEAEREWARRVVEALDDGRIGAAQLDGEMIDMPHLARARQILAARP